MSGPSSGKIEFGLGGSWGLTALIFLPCLTGFAAAVVVDDWLLGGCAYYASLMTALAVINARAFRRAVAGWSGREARGRQSTQDPMQAFRR